MMPRIVVIIIAALLIWLVSCAAMPNERAAAHAVWAREGK